MSLSTLRTAVFGLATSALAQQIGTNTAEVHPSLPYQKCTASGCTTVNTNAVLDANWRWLHTTTGYTNCYTGNKWDATLCPDATTCAANCALDGADYSGTYGITTPSSGALKLQLVTGSNVGSRNYLINGDKYEVFNLLNQEFTFDVDVSNLPCGLNGALYFVRMDADGGLSEFPTNKAGAKYGTGYCDAQCPHDLKFVEGKANIANWTGTSTNSGTGNLGSCCTEMDIWEANSISSAVTPHTCSADAPCSGAGCSTCDQAGCDFNTYRWGNASFYEPSGPYLDTTKPMTVVTQFITSDNTATGDLTAIRRLYVQNGVIINNAYTNIAGITPTNEIDDQFCTDQKTVSGDTNVFGQLGGMKAFGKELAKGMVLVLSIWDDYSVNMLWLDSTYPTDSTAVGAKRGTCSTSSGKPADVESNTPGASVIYSNIKFGDIGTTYKGTGGTTGNTGSGSSSSSKAASSSTSKAASSSTSKAATTTSKAATTTSKVATTTTTTKAATTTAAAGTVAHYGQCGGQGWTGGTTCVSPYTCKAQGSYYSQCL